MKAKTAAEAVSLEAIPNIGPAVAKNLAAIGIHQPMDLVGQYPFDLFQQLCCQNGIQYDLCLLDTFIAATRHSPGRYTKERQKTLQDSTLRTS